MADRRNTVTLDELCQENLSPNIVKSMSQIVKEGYPHTFVTVSFRKGVTIDIYERISMKKLPVLIASFGGMLVTFAEFIYQYYPTLRGLFIP